MKFLQKVIALVLLGLLVSHTMAMAADKGNFQVSPTTHEGKKWRIGFYEAGEYIEYQKTLVATIRGLMELGWIEAVDIPMQNGEQTKELWNWLALEMKSEFLEFVADAHYSADWDDALREKISSEIVERLNSSKDIDLMLAMGTWAGQDLANDKHQTPTVALAVSDAVYSGVVESIEDSGFDHIHARVDPFRYQRQVQIFYDIIGFQKLGVIYENTSDGRSYAAISDVEKVAQEFGFDIVHCHTKGENESTNLTAEEEVERVKACFHQLGKEAQALYVTLHTGINSASLPELVQIANSYNIPTFSQAGSDEVKAGLLLSIALADFKYVGLFHAETIAKIFNGAKPRQVDMLFEDPPKIAINLKTAEIIGYDPPVDVLGASDEIYEEIAAPK